MKTYEALLLGSGLLSPEIGHITSINSEGEMKGCALGMIGAATVHNFTPTSNYSALVHIMLDVHRKRWLDREAKVSPNCGCPAECLPYIIGSKTAGYTDMIAHLFDFHVMQKEVSFRISHDGSILEVTHLNKWTMEMLVDYIKKAEEFEIPEEKCETASSKEPPEYALTTTEKPSVAY